MVEDRCVVGAACSLTTKETLASDTIICGKDQQRRVRTAPTQVGQATVLTGLGSFRTSLCIANIVSFLLLMLCQSRDFLGYHLC